MSQRAQRVVKTVRVIGAVLSFRWVAKVRANRQAVRAGKPKPYPPGTILLDVLDSGLDAADVIKPGWRGDKR